MKKELREKMPQWANGELSNSKYFQRESDDLDSHFVSVLYKDMFGLQVNQFYNFNDLYQIEETDKEHISIDIALEEGKTFDNHVTLFHRNDRVNKESANINNVLRINRNNYKDKYAGSTLLQVISLYKPFDLHSLSDEQKMILWAIDSSADGYYNSDFRHIHAKYIELLELEPIADVLKKYSKYELYEVKKKYGLSEKIYIDENGKLNTKIDLAGLQGLFNLDFTLASKSFTKIDSFNYHHVEKLSQKTYNKSNPNLYTFAITRKNEVKCSTRIS